LTARSGPRARAALSALVVVALGLAVVTPPAADAPPALAASFEERLAACLACHGGDGQSRLAETPSLGGQPAFFVVAQLFLFREGRRANAVMTTAAKGLTNDDLRAFANAIARLPPPPPPADAGDGTRATRGQTLARQHHCTVCHNPDFSGRDQMPRLANQREDYLLKAMREFKRGERIGYAGAMAVELRDLTDGDLLDLAHFLAHLPRGAR
jgi:cytochrome c553